MNRGLTDLLRIIAVTCIVYNHTIWPDYVAVTGPDATLWHHACAWLNQAGKASVLFFLFLSGFAFGAHPMNRSFHSLHFYKNRALRILPPFLIALSVGFALRVAYHPEEAHGPLRFLQGLLTGSHWMHLYFVSLLVYLYALFPLLRRLPANPVSAIVLSMPLVVYMALFDLPRGAVMFFGLQAAPEFFGGWQALHRQLVQSPSPFAQTWLQYAVYALPTFVFGLWASRIRAPEQTRRPMRFVLLGAALIGAFALVLLDFYSGLGLGIDADTSGRVWRPSVVLYAMVAIVLLYNMESNPGGRIIKRLSRASFLVYLFHPYLIECGYGLPISLRTALVIVFSWALALGLNFLGTRYPNIGLFLGEGDRRPTRPAAGAELPANAASLAG